MKVLVILDIDPDEVLEYAENSPYEGTIESATHFCISRGHLDDISVLEVIPPDEIPFNWHDIGSMISSKLD